MDEQLKRIQSFLSSPHCIFSLDALDYPSYFHQDLIISYISLRQMLTKPHGHIIRELHSVSDRLEQVSKGFLYCCLLDSQLFQIVLEYLMVLRVEVWAALAKNFSLLLKDYASSLKNKCRANFGPLLTQILSYNVCTTELVEFMVKNISNYDFSEETLQANRQILNSFASYLRETDTGISPELRVWISHFLFIKAARLLSSPYHSECAAIIKLIWEKCPEQCRVVSSEATRVLSSFVLPQRQTLSPSPFFTLINSIYNQLISGSSETDRNEQNPYWQGIMGVLVERRTENILLFITHEGLSALELKTQIGWLERQINTQKSALPMMFDMAEWLISGSEFAQVRVILLEWLLRKASAFSSDAFGEIRRIILNPLIERQFNIKRCVTSFAFMKKMLQVNGTIASDFLIHLIRQITDSQSLIKQAFTQANLHNYLRLEDIRNAKMIPEVVKSELFKIISGLSPDYPQPDPYVLQDSPHHEEINYQMDQERSLPEGIKVHAQISENSYHIMIEEEFFHLIDSHLTAVLDDPTYANFVAFFNQVCDVGLSIRKQTKDSKSTNILCREAARVIFTLYNRQFERLNSIEPYQTSVIFHMLSLVGQDWHRLTHRLDVMKSIIKNLIELSPVAEVAFWTYFFSYFEYGGANYKSLKNWLIPKEKNRFVIAAIEALTGRQERDLRDKATVYGIA